MVYWKENLLFLPTGKTGKLFMDELAKLFNAWTDDSPLNEMAIKAVMIIPSLLLQKPSKKSKSRDNLEALEQKMEPWQPGDLLELLQKSLEIWRNLKSVKGSKTAAQISKKFVKQW